MNDKLARDMATIAVHTLRKSERGRRALHDFRTLLDNGGDGLDDENWRALIVLCQLTLHGKCFAVDEQFDPFARS